MVTATLATFIAVNRDEIIGRCRAKVATRVSPPPTSAEIDRGVPLFLDQLRDELSRARSKGPEISAGALEHGHDLLQRGFTIGQVVHDYGDVCQSITDLAVETDASISIEEFRTLNRCLDDAIAGAVTEFARAHDLSRDTELSEFRGFVDAADAAFEVLQSGRVGVGGATAAVVRRSLAALRAHVERCEEKASLTGGGRQPSPFLNSLLRPGL